MTEMEYRQLGATGVRVSAIGFGGLGIGGGYGRRDRDEALRTVARALELGVTFFDTAPSYGRGLREEILGEVLGPVRERVVIATKPEGRKPDFIRRSVEDSLRRLRTDYIDVLQLRDPSPSKLERFSVLETFAALREEGKIRFGSVTLGDARQEEEGHLAVDAGFATIQLAYNLVFPNAARTVLPRAKEAGVGIVARGPLCKGFLTGRFTGMPADIKADPNFRWWTAEEAQTLLRLQHDLSFLVRPGERSLAQAAIQFVLRSEAVSTTIPSVETVTEVDELVGALGAPRLENDEIARATAAVAKYPAVDY